MIRIVAIVVNIVVLILASKYYMNKSHSSLKCSHYTPIMQLLS